MIKDSIIHSCGVKLHRGEFDTYHTKQVTEDDETMLVYVGECPACGEKLDPETDRIKHTDRCR